MPAAAAVAHRQRMNRRSFVLGATTVAACMRAAPTRQRTGIRAVAFDLFTIFDPRSIDAAVAAEVPADPTLAQLWKLRTFEYCWLKRRESTLREKLCCSGTARRSLTTP